MAISKPQKTDPSEITRREGSEARARDIGIWVTVLLLYGLLLSSIGYIAFWNQDFNDPNMTIGQHMAILHEISEAHEDVDEQQLATIIQESIKTSTDGAGDLQELASQSFNIVLGAMLAFLSSSTTMVFQRLSAGVSPRREPEA